MFIEILEEKLNLIYTHSKDYQSLDRSQSLFSFKPQSDSINIHNNRFVRCPARYFKPTTTGDNKKCILTAVFLLVSLKKTEYEILAITMRTLTIERCSKSVCKSDVHILMLWPFSSKLWSFRWISWRSSWKIIVAATWYLLWPSSCPKSPVATPDKEKANSKIKLAFAQCFCFLSIWGLKCVVLPSFHFCRFLTGKVMQIVESGVWIVQLKTSSTWGNSDLVMRFQYY